MDNYHIKWRTINAICGNRDLGSGGLVSAVRDAHGQIARTPRGDVDLFYEGTVDRLPRTGAARAAHGETFRHKACVDLRMR